MAAWRIVVGISLIPAFGTLYQRLTLPESKRYVRSRQRVSELEGKPSDSTVTLEKDDDEIHVGPGTISPSRWTHCVLTSCFLVSLYIAHGDHEVSGFEPDADVAAASGHAPKAHISGESLLLHARRCASGLYVPTCIASSRGLRVLLGMAARKDTHWHMHVLVPP